MSSGKRLVCCLALLGCGVVFSVSFVAGVAAQMVLSDAPAAMAGPGVANALSLAIEAHDLYGSLALIGASAELYSVNEDGLDPVLLSVRENCPLVLGSLIDRGVPLESVDALGNSALHLAACAGNVYMLDMLVEKGCYVDARNNGARTPLCVAIEAGQIEAVKMLLELGADPFVKVTSDAAQNAGLLAAQTGQTAIRDLLWAAGCRYSIYNAIEIGDLATVGKLLDEKPTLLEDGGPSGVTPLLGAVGANNLEAVSYLIERGAKVDVQSFEGINSLRLAVLKDYREMAKLLIEKHYGPMLNLRDYGVTQGSVLHFAAEKGTVEMLGLLIDAGALTDVLDANGESAFFAAVKNRRLEQAKLLLAKGANLDQKNNDSQTPLHVSVVNEDVDMTLFLLEQGSEVNPMDEKRNTPLHVASASGNVALAKLLLEHGADIGLRDQDGQGPFHYAVANDRLEMASYLLSAGSDIEMPDKQKRTALHLGIEKGLFAMVELLVGASANVEAETKNKETPLFTAIHANRGDIAKLLVQHGARLDAINQLGESLLFAAAECNTNGIAAWLVSSGLDVNAINNAKETLLHRATEKGSLDTVEFLLAQKLDVNAKDASGKEPIHLACARGHVLIVKALVSRGADVSAKDNIGLQPIHISAGAGHWGPIQLFLVRGVSIDAVDDLGNTPLHHAAMNGQERVIKLLISRGADLTVYTVAGKTPLELAAGMASKRLPKEGATPSQISKQFGYERAEYYLRAALIQELADCAKYGETEKLLEFIEYYKELVGFTLFGQSLLQIAAQNGQAGTVALLLDNGLDINQVSDNYEGNTALHYAVAAAQADVARLLLERGANRELKNFEGMSALEIAQRAKIEPVLPVFDAVPDGALERANTAELNAAPAQ